MLPNRDRRRFLVYCSSCDRRLVLFLKIECDLCTLRGPPLLCAHSPPPSIIGKSHFSCKF